MITSKDTLPTVKPYTIKDREGRVIGVINEPLSMAYLGHFDLTNADFRGCDLSEACLDSVSLKGADFRGADLQYADLGDNTLDDCLTDENTIFPEEEEEPRRRPCWM